MVGPIKNDGLAGSAHGPTELLSWHIPKKKLRKTTTKNQSA
jgi:hypothetical protein